MNHGAGCHYTKAGNITAFIHTPPFLTVDDGLNFFLSVSTQLNFNKWTGDAAAGLRKVSGSNHLEKMQQCGSLTKNFWEDGKLLRI